MKLAGLLLLGSRFEVIHKGRMDEVVDLAGEFFLVGGGEAELGLGQIATDGNCTRMG